MFDSVVARNTSLSSLGTSIRNVHPLVTLDVEAGCSESSSFNHWMGFILVRVVFCCGEASEASASSHGRVPLVSDQSLKCKFMSALNTMLDVGLFRYYSALTDCLFAAVLCRALQGKKRVNSGKKRSGSSIFCTSQGFTMLFIISAVGLFCH